NDPRGSDRSVRPAPAPALLLRAVPGAGELRAAARIHKQLAAPAPRCRARTRDREPADAVLRGVRRRTAARGATASHVLLGTMQAPEPTPPPQAQRWK